jgi:hypothetical protein
VYFLGLPWLHKFKSAHLNGVGEDAEYLAEQMSRSIPRSLAPRTGVENRLI